jgi:hypothetical protein
MAYVIGMKVIEKASSSETAAQNAIQQIIDLGYADRYVNKPILMPLVVAEDTRNMAACASSSRTGYREAGIRWFI